MDLPNKGGELPAPPPKKHVEQVITGASMAKRPATKRFKDYIMAESPGAIAKNVGKNVLVPRAKAGFEEACISFLRGILWGGDSATRPIEGLVKGTVLRGGNMNYNQISSAQPSALSQARVATGQTIGAYKDVTCQTQQQAETLLANLYLLLNEYRVVAVADLYEAAGLTPGTHDSAYGWMSLDSARISKSREGFVLELPRPSLI